MYFLYKKSKKAVLPKFDYMLKNFNEFYDLAKVLDISFHGAYNINIKSDNYDDIIGFINMSESYRYLIVYIETNQTLIDYIALRKPDVSLKDSKSDFEIYKDLIAKYRILFDKKSISLLYGSIGHEYDEMESALSLIKTTFPNVRPVTEKELSQLFVLNDLIYPRQVCIYFLLFDRWRYSKLERCIEYFGNDLVLYSIRKTIRNLYDEKVKYLKTGAGSKLIKSLSINNILHMLRCMDYERDGFMDIRTILMMYEKGVSINDFVQERTVPVTNEEYNPIG